MIEKRDKNNWIVVFLPTRRFTPVDIRQNKKWTELIGLRCDQWLVHMQFQKETAIVLQEDERY